MIFAVRSDDGRKVAIVTAIGRENAKHKALILFSGGNSDHYIAEPITYDSDEVFIQLTLSETWPIGG